MQQHFHYGTDQRAAIMERTAFGPNEPDGPALPPMHR